jgi:hypothetical protein
MLKKLIISMLSLLLLVGCSETSDLSPAGTEINQETISENMDASIEDLNSKISENNQSSDNSIVSNVKEIFGLVNGIWNSATENNQTSSEEIKGNFGSELEKIKESANDITVTAETKQKLDEVLEEFKNSDLDGWKAEIYEKYQNLPDDKKTDKKYVIDFLEQEFFKLSFTDKMEAMAEFWKLKDIILNS